MKNIIQSILLFLLVLVALYIVLNTRGTGNLDFSVDLSKISTEEKFSYSIVNDEYNGEYKNTKGNNMYLMVGKNADGTYRIYFIHIGAAAFGRDNKYVELRLDDVKLDSNNSYAFNTANNVPLKLTIQNRQIIVSSNLGTGDASMEGIYMWRKSISRFEMSQFQMYNN